MEGIAGKSLEPRGGGHRILVVDDDESNRILALRMLERIGFEGRAVSDGAEALRELERDAPHLVLMDCHMPTLDGYAATRELRRRETVSGGHIPVIAMTAGATPRDRAACADAGMDDYLAKPVMLDSLAGVLTRWLGTTPRSADELRSESRATGFVEHDGAADAADFDRLVRELGSEAARRFAETYLRGLTTRVAAIASALDERSPEMVRDAAHALKSPSSALGAMALSSLCQRLETEAKDGHLPSPDVIEELRARCDEVKSLLERQIQE